MAAKIPTPRYSVATDRPECKHLPAPYKLRRYYIPEEVAIHNTADNCWVSIFHKVFDLTTLLQDNIHLKESDPLKKAAGQDISHWFDEMTRDPVTYIDPLTNLKQYYHPWGRFLHVPPQGPDSSWDISVKCQWWRDDKYVIGNLTKRTRPI